MVFLTTPPRRKRSRPASRKSDHRAPDTGRGPEVGERPDAGKGPRWASDRTPAEGS